MSRAPGSYAGLTRMQAELLSILRAAEADGKTTPSFQEMTDALGLKSKSGVHRLLTSLEERGFITRRFNRARSIQCVDRPITNAEVAQPVPSKSLLSQFSIGQLVGEIESRGLKVMAA